jgi:hypothetical protein
MDHVVPEQVVEPVTAPDAVIVPGDLLHAPPKVMGLPTFVLVIKNGLPVGVVIERVGVTISFVSDTVVCTLLPTQSVSLKRSETAPSGTPLTFIEPEKAPLEQVND